MLNLGGEDVDTQTPMGPMVFTAIAALSQMELEIKRERITDSVAKRRAAGKDLGGRRQTFTDSQIWDALRLIDSGSRPPRWPGIWGCPGLPSTAASESSSPQLPERGDV